MALTYCFESHLIPCTLARCRENDLAVVDTEGHTLAVRDAVRRGVWGDYKVLTGTINGDPADITAGIYLDTDKRYKVIEEDQSRPFVFIYKDNVYMLQNIKPRMKTAFDAIGAIRSTLQIWKYDMEMNLIDFYRIRNDASIQYFSIVDSKGRIYMCFTEDKRHLNFALKGDIAVMPIDLQSLEKHGW